MTTFTDSSTTSTLPLPPLQPSRWLLVGNADWLAQVQAALQADNNPLLRWRADFGMLQTMTPEQLDGAARDALLAGTTQVHLHCQPTVLDDAMHLLSNLLDHAPGVQCSAAAAEAPFGPLLHALAQPDGLALARWITGLRHRTQVRLYRPATGQPAVDKSEALFLQCADEAFRHWLEGFLDGADDADVDAIYGQVDVEALAGQPLLQGGSRPQPPQAPAGRTAQVAFGRGIGPGVMRASAASAAPAGRPRVAELPADGCIRGSFSGGLGTADPAAGSAASATGDVFSLQWPMDGLTEGPKGTRQADVQVLVDLDAAAWAGRRPTVLVLHPAGLVLPVLVELPLTPRPAVAGGAAAGGRVAWRLAATVPMGRAAFVQCLGDEAAFQLLDEPVDGSHR